MENLKDKIEELNQELPQLYADYKHNKRIRFLNKLIIGFQGIMILLVFSSITDLFYAHQYFIGSIITLAFVCIYVLYDLTPKDNFLSNVANLKKEEIQAGLISVSHQINYINEMNFLYRNGTLTEEKMNSSIYQIVLKDQSIKLKRFS